MIGDIKVKEAKIYLDKERTLRFDFYAMGLIEENHGNVFKFLNNIEDKPFTSIPVLLWGMLKHEDSELTVEKIAQMLPFDVGFMNNIVGTITSLTQESMPQVDESKNSPKPNPKKK